MTCLAFFWAWPTVAGPLDRVANTTIQLPSGQQPAGYSVVDAFPGLNVDYVVAIATPPGENNRLFLVNLYGKIYVITNLAAPTLTVFLDLSGKAVAGGEAGVLGLAFHPNFRNNGQFFVFYTLNRTTVNPDGSRNTGFHDQVSRFELEAGNPNRASLDSEVVLLSQYDRAENHNGGDLHFGPEGYLYISLGDEGGGSDSFGNSQRIDRNFFSGILRIDVDRRAGNLAPNRHGASSANYSVPADNPYVGASSFNGVAIDPSRVRTEFWAVGLRNPWRFTFDSATGALLGGDVGQGAREEINLIVRGGNYGWNYFEGLLRYLGIPGPEVREIMPLVEYARPGDSLDTERQGACVIGGVVYRGTRLPELAGKYIFGDWWTGNIWALQHDGVRATEFTRLVAGPSMNCFGTDPRNGDVLVGGAGVRRLVKSGTAIEPPPTLAHTGIFTDVASLTPAAGVEPYDVNVSFWSDGATKRRWFSLPELSQKMTFRSTANWSFPAGAVWVKHFDLEMVRGVPGSARRIETRVLVKTAEGVYGLSYRWDESQANASLVPSDGMDEGFEIAEAGGTRHQVWHYPSRSECISCHTSAAGQVLGFNTAQLNRPHDYHGTTANQLQALSEAGYFTSTISQPESMNRLAAADNATATVEHRVRSYLAANCVQCHQPAASGAGRWDARIQVPTSQAGLIDGALNNTGGNPNARVIRGGSLADSMLYLRIDHRGAGQMPPLATTTVDAENVALVAQWIEELRPREVGDPITLEISGDGSIQGLTDQQRLISGKSYKVTAAPGKGLLFSHWSGSVESAANPLTFVMAPGMHLRANFVTNLLQSFQGKYVGIFQEGTEIRHGRAGAITVKLAASGAFSAFLELGRERLAFSGRFTPEGAAAIPLVHPTLGTATIQLVLDGAGPFPLRGQLTTTGWSASLSAVRSISTVPARYTWVSGLNGTHPEAPPGESFGAVRVSATGSATLSGYLADGTPVSHATVVARDGRIPLCLPKAGRNGSALGWAVLSADGHRLAGSVTWTRRDATAPANDYRVDLPVNGSIYASSNRLPADVRIQVTCSNGDLVAPWSFLVGANGRATGGLAELPGATVPSLKLIRGTGLFSGKFAPPGERAARRLRGALLWEQRIGSGFFSTADGTTNGRIEVRY